MEVFMLFLGNPDGSDYKPSEIENTAELPQFLVDVDDFIGPLFQLLSGRDPSVDRPEIFDRVVFADPRLADASLWNGDDLKETKRLNPELVRMLAAVVPGRLDGLTSGWFAAPSVRSHMLDERPTAVAEEEARAIANLKEILANVIALAKRSVKKKKDVMMSFYWSTS
jgi:hypothetical protein